MVGLLSRFSSFVLLHFRCRTWRVYGLLTPGICVGAALTRQQGSQSDRGGPASWGRCV